MSERSAMASGGGPKRLDGTRPFAETRGQLAATARRLSTLLEACTGDCERRLVLLRRLPACATVEPFAAMQDGPLVGAEKGALPPAQGMATSVRSAQHGLAAASARAGRGTAVAPRPDDAARRRPRTNPDVPLASAEPERLPGALTGMSGLAGALVGELIARFPDHDPGIRADRDTARRASRAHTRPSPSAPQPLPVPYPALARHRDTAPSSMRLAAQAAARGGPPERPSPAPVATASAALLGALLETGGQAVRASASAVPGGVPLLAQVLAGLAPAGAGRRARRPDAASGPAPRAASRLFGTAAPTAAANPHAGGETKPPAAPQGDAIEEAGAGSGLARQLNRLLLDQAWLRGVDLT